MINYLKIKINKQNKINKSYISLEKNSEMAI